MGGLVLICFFLSAAYVNTPTTWTLNINMDNNTLEAIKTTKEIQEMNLNHINNNTLEVEDENHLCKAYADLNNVSVHIKDGKVYYFIENKWIQEETLWESCLR